MVPTEIFHIKFYGLLTDLTPKFPNGIISATFAFTY